MERFPSIRRFLGAWVRSFCSRPNNRILCHTLPHHMTATIKTTVENFKAVITRNDSDHCLGRTAYKLLQSSLNFPCPLPELPLYRRPRHFSTSSQPWLPSLLSQLWVILHLHHPYASWSRPTLLHPAHLLHPHDCPMKKDSNNVKKPRISWMPLSTSGPIPLCHSPI